MKKTLALFFAVLFCLTVVFTACGGNDTPVTTTTGSGENAGTTVTTPGSDTAVADYLEVIAAGGASSFTGIRPDSEDKALSGAVTDFRNSLNKAYSSNVGISNDWVKGLGKDETYSSDAYEILVGPTNRAETAEALKQIDEEGYIITAIGNKLIIAGHNTYATIKALDAFTEAYLSGTATGALRFAYADVTIGVAGSNRVALTKGADLRIMTLNINCSDNNAANRYEHILNVVMNYLPDIMCFQECNKAQYTNVINQLRSQYGVATTYHSNGSTYVYTPILYLKDKYEVVEAGADWLRDRYTGTNTKSIAHAVLKTKDTGKIFGIINLHGAYCSSSYSGYENMSSADLNKIANGWREGNVRQIQEVQAAIEEKYGQIPILHTADYNFNSDSTPYRMMIEAGLTEAEVSATESHVTGIKTTHTVGQKSIAGKSIDHIFYNADRITALTHYIGNEADSDLRASDHLPVYADVKFN